MAKFNRASARPAPVGPGTTTGRTTTYEGGAAYTRDTRSELVLLAVVNMVGEDTFYEGASDRDNRFRALVRAAAVEDAKWTEAFIRWLRGEANMRSASLVAAAEAVKGRLEAGLHGGNRTLVDAACLRADEPGELLAYWTSQYGRAIPKPIKRGLADAVRRLYNERSLLKYDSGSRGYRFADVLELVHPAPAADKPWQGDLFKHAIDRRHDRGDAVPDSLPVLRARAKLTALPVAERRAFLDRPDAPERLAEAGFTWESLAGWLQGPLDARVWEAMLPSMGYMACLAEGTPVWLADGTTAPIEEVVARRLPVLSYDKAWDTRPVKYGPNQGPRDHSVGNLVPTVPSAWLDMGVRPVAAVKFASGRVIEATYDHRWVRQRRTGRQAWEWTTTGELRVGDRIPVPLTADAFGDEGDAWDGYFVGAMLGDGGMTALTPEFHGDPDDGAAAFMREYAVKYGCEVREDANGTITRMRFPFKQGKRNPLAEILRRYEVWGKRCEVKALPNRPFSREFWIGVLSGLIDTDGCVRERTNAKGTLHGSVEYATVSRRLAEQVSDVLLRLGVINIVREKAPRSMPQDTVQSRQPLFTVEVNRATALVRLAGLLDLRIGYKAAKLAGLAERLAHVTPAASEMHGYDPAVALDRVVSIEDAGERATYCVTVDTSNLFVANGIVTGNCLRNLRNFDEAGVSDEVAGRVAARLADPEEVAASRQFPYRFLSAYRAAPSTRWAHPLDKALAAATANVPKLPGRTLVLVDVSGSMLGVVSARSKVRHVDVGALFGVALAHRGADVDLIGFATDSFKHRLRKGGSVLKEVEAFCRKVGKVGYGTETVKALHKWYRGHDRVVIVSDMQAFGHWGSHGGVSVSEAVPAHIPVFGVNTTGYAPAALDIGQPNRYEIGGFSDKLFTLVDLLSSGRDASWPWER